MYTNIIEFIALVLFAGSVWHALRFQDGLFAQQWFTAGYLAILVRETINQVVLQTYSFSPTILTLGVMPVLLALLWPSVFYLAFQFARRCVSADKPLLIAGLMFLIAASFALPIEATAAQLQWWLYASPTHPIFGGVPLAAPLIWGGMAAVFYAFFWRARQFRLPERGKLYALITLSPVIAVADVLITVLFNAVV